MAKVKKKRSKAILKAGDASAEAAQVATVTKKKQKTKSGSREVDGAGGDAVSAELKRKLLEELELPDWAQADDDEDGGAEAEAEAESKPPKGFGSAVAEGGESSVAVAPPKPKKAKKVKARGASDKDGGAVVATQEPVAAAHKEGDLNLDAAAEKEPARVPDDHKVWVAGLPFDMSLKETVQRDFAECGTIARFDMPFNKKGLPDGTAFIYYEAAAGLERALERDGSTYLGRTIQVKPAKSNRNAARSDESASRPKAGKPELTVFIGGLSYEATEEKVRADFGECGAIESIRMLKGPDGNFKGIAFIVYEKEAAVKSALAWNGKEYGGRKLKVSIADQGPSKKDGGDAKEGGKGGKSKGKEKGDGGGSPADKNLCTVFVGSLSSDTELDTLTKDFAACGEVESIRMIVAQDGFFKGAAFIVFKRQEAVKEALKWDGEYYGGRHIKVSQAQHGRGSASGCEAAKGKGKGKGDGGKGKSKSKGNGKDKGASPKKGLGRRSAGRKSE